VMFSNEVSCRKRFRTPEFSRHATHLDSLLSVFSQKSHYIHRIHAKPSGSRPQGHLLLVFLGARTFSLCPTNTPGLSLSIGAFDTAHICFLTTPVYLAPNIRSVISMPLNHLFPPSKLLVRDSYDSMQVWIMRVCPFHLLILFYTPVTCTQLIQNPYFQPTHS
jgi:hypothetical protein